MATIEPKPNLLVSPIAVRYRVKDWAKIEKNGGKCCARTEDGGRCASTDLLRGGRCRLHGGLSTGPRTLEGRRRSAMNVPGMTYELFLAQQEKRALRDSKGG